MQQPAVLQDPLDEWLSQVVLGLQQLRLRKQLLLLPHVLCTQQQHLQVY
jgi:hypothetical protein